MKRNIIWLAASFVFSAILSPTSAQIKIIPNQKEKLKQVDVDAFLFDEKLWESSIVDFEKKHKDFKFEWMSATKDRLRSEGGNVKTLGHKSGEILIVSDSGSETLKSITIMLFNKGDDGSMQPRAFDQLFSDLSAKLTAKTSDRPEDKSDRGTVQMTKTFWKKDNTAYQLEKSVNTENNQPEFMRLRMASLRTARDGGSTANRSTLKSNVIQDKATGDVYIGNVPMVDQGKKGYCACASAARIYQYYGQQTDQHEMAQIAGSTAESGTALNEMVESLKKVTSKLNSRVIVLYEYPKGLSDLPTKKNGDDYRAWERAMSKLEGGLKEMTRDVNEYQREAEKRNTKVVDIPGMERGKIPRGSYMNQSHVDFFRKNCDADLFREIMMEKSSYSRFISKIKEYIDQGIPVGWCLQLGMFSEPGLPQANGGHMRLIIGYNENTKELIYSDSWGNGHGKKKMDAGKAFCMTMGILVMPPTR